MTHESSSARSHTAIIFFSLSLFRFSSGRIKLSAFCFLLDDPGRENPTKDCYHSIDRDHIAGWFFALLLVLEDTSIRHPSIDQHAVELMTDMTHDNWSVIVKALLSPRKEEEGAYLRAKGLFQTIYQLGCCYGTFFRKKR